jgi:hypothetical protein
MPADAELHAGLWEQYQILTAGIRAIRSGGARIRGDDRDLNDDRHSRRRGLCQRISQLPWPTFLALNFVAAGLWSCAIVSAGYAQVSEKVMSDASSGLGFVMLVAFLGLSWILSKKLERVVERN